MTRKPCAIQHSMKLTFKIVLDKRYTKGNDTYPLKVRIYCGSNYKEKSIDLFIPETEWDATSQTVLPSFTEHEMYNTKIISVKSKVQKQILLADLNWSNSILAEKVSINCVVIVESSLQRGRGGYILPFYKIAYFFTNFLTSLPFNFTK